MADKNLSKKIAKAVKADSAKYAGKMRPDATGNPAKRMSASEAKKKSAKK